jgi:hypothetical protein
MLDGYRSCGIEVEEYGMPISGIQFFYMGLDMGLNDTRSVRLSLREGVVLEQTSTK